MGTDTFCPRPELHFVGVCRALIMKVYDFQDMPEMVTYHYDYTILV